MQYIKKPIEVEAVIFNYGKDGGQSIKDFCGNCVGKISMNRHPGAVAEAEILTLEDGHDNRVKHIATNGDYIIKGISGEFYPCKPDIFLMTYDKA